MSILFTLLGLVLIGGFIAMIIAVSKETKSVKQTTSEVMTIVERDNAKEELKELKKLIKIKQQELETLVHATEQAKRRTVTNLTVEQEDAINLYENMGIRLPVDIIEELSYSNNVTYHSAVAFIEMQRKIWKAQFQVTMTKGMIG